MERSHLRLEGPREAAQSGAGLLAVHFRFSAGGNWDDFHGTGARRHDRAGRNAFVEVAVRNLQEDNNW